AALRVAAGQPAAGPISSRAAALTERVGNPMLTPKIKMLTVALTALAFVGLSLGGLGYATLAPDLGTGERTRPGSRSSETQRPAAEQKAIAALQAVGGRIITDQTQPGEPVIGVYLLSRQFTEGDLRHLKEFRNLKTLILPRITDAAMKELRELKGLE